MSNDAKWIIGAVIGSAGLGVLVVGWTAGTFFTDATQPVRLGSDVILDGEPAPRNAAPAPPGPATELAARREGMTSLQAATQANPQADSLTVTGTVGDVWLHDGRILVMVWEDPEFHDVLVRALFDPQPWEETLGEISRGARVRLDGVNAVAIGARLVEMEGTRVELLGEAAP